MGPNCLDCKRPMCQRHSPAPMGMVRHGGKGYCGACFTRRKRHGTLPDTGNGRGKSIFKPTGTAGTIECEGHGCTKTLRPHGARAEDWPGTFARKARNRCSTCYEVAYRDLTASPEDVARTAEALTAYLAWRRPYRAKAGAL